MHISKTFKKFDNETNLSSTSSTFSTSSTSSTPSSSLSSIITYYLSMYLSIYLFTNTFLHIYFSASFFYFFYFLKPLYFSSIYKISSSHCNIGCGFGIVVKGLTGGGNNLFKATKRSMSQHRTGNIGSKNPISFHTLISSK